MKKVLFTLTLVFAFLVACNNTKNTDQKPEETQGTSTNEPTEIEQISKGKVVYDTQCKLCHGGDGTLGASGAANLKKSLLKEADAITVVTYGKGAMMGYGEIISKEDVECVVAYIETLRN